jgi:hypothetical protein
MRQGLSFGAGWRLLEGGHSRGGEIVALQVGGIFYELIAKFLELGPLGLALIICILDRCIMMLSLDFKR